VSSAASAHPVQVDPGSYAGEWRAAGASYASGKRTVDLPTGTTSMTVGGVGSFAVSVSASGTVSVPNGVSAVGGAGTLTFNTVSVAVDPAAFGGEWRVDRGVPGRFVVGPQTAIFVPGVSFSILAGGAVTFSFVADTSGSLVIHNGISATSTPGTLTFNTVSVAVDPAAFGGQWRVDRGVPGSFVVGPQTAIFVPGVRFGILAGDAGSFSIVVDGFGNTSADNGVSALGGANTLTFNTSAITIDPGGFAGTWHISRATSDTAGIQTVQLVPAVAFQLGAPGLGSQFITVALQRHAGRLHARRVRLHGELRLHRRG